MSLITVPEKWIERNFAFLHKTQSCFCIMLLCISMTLSQVLLSIVVLRLLHALGFLPLRPYCRQLGERLLVPAVGLGAHSVLATWAKASGSSACLYRLVLPLLPVLTLVLGLCLKVASTPSVHVAVLVSVLSGTYVSVTGAWWDGYNILYYKEAPKDTVLNFYKKVVNYQYKEEEEMFVLNIKHRKNSRNWWNSKSSEDY